MAHYGQLIDTGETKQDKFNSLLVQFYNNPVMVKLKTVNNHGMFVAKVHCLLSAQKRYIIAYVDRDMSPNGTHVRLDSLRWDNFQTRTLDEMEMPANTPYVQYAPKRIQGLDNAISKIDASNNSTTYQAVGEFPLTVTMIHPKKMSFNYQDKGTIVSALETFQTILTW